MSRRYLSNQPGQKVSSGTGSFGEMVKVDSIEDLGSPGPYSIFLELPYRCLYAQISSGRL